MDSQCCVYVIDDEPIVCKSLVAVLSSLGISAIEFSRAADFFSQFVDGEPAQQCVLVDLRMPDMSGIELKQRLMAEGFKVPVILLTGFCTDATVEQAQAAEIFDILEKPCRPDALEQAVRRAFEVSPAEH